MTAGTAASDGEVMMYINNGPGDVDGTGTDPVEALAVLSGTLQQLAIGMAHAATDLSALRALASLTLAQRLGLSASMRARVRGIVAAARTRWIGSPGDPVACLAAGRVATQIIRRRAAVTVAHGAQLRAGLARQASTRAGCRTGSCRSSVGHAGWRSGGNAGNDSGCTASRSGSWSRSPASPASPARHRPGLGRTRRRVAHSRR